MRSAAKQYKVKRKQALQAGGMVTSKEPWLIPRGKLARAVNIRLITTPYGDGKLALQAVTRPGTRRLSASPLPGGQAIKAHLRYLGVDFVAGDTGLYRLVDGEPVFICSLASAPELLPYRGKVMVLDGGYAKSVDPSDGYACSVLWDEDGYLWDWLDADLDAGQKLYSGSVTRFGIKDASPAFGPGAIPITQVSVWLSRVGSPTGSVLVKAYAADGTTLLGSGELTDLTTTLGTASTLQSLYLEAAAGQDLSTPQNTERYIVIEYASGDSSNCVQVHYANVSSGGKGVSYSGAWSLQAAKQPVMAVTPGLPPMASTGAVRDDRLWLAGGDWVDEADKSKAHYSGLGNCWSWGSRMYVGGSAGWIGVDRLDGGVINQITGWFGGLVISKSGRQSLHLISGRIPGEDLGVTRLFLDEGSQGKTLTQSGNSLLFLNDSVLALEGVQEFGDVRKLPRSQDIQDLVNQYQGEGAFSVYHRAHDQYFLQLPGLDSTLVLHLLPRAWTMYSWAGFVPTCFSHDDATTFIGADNGHLYCLEEDLTGVDGYLSGAEPGQSWQVELWGGMDDYGHPGLDKHFKNLSYDLSARLGCSGEIRFKRDFSKLVEDRLTRQLNEPLDDDVTVGELVSLIVGSDGELYSVGLGRARKGNQSINFVAKLAQVGLYLNPGGAPVYLGPVTLDLAPMGRS